MQDRSYFWIYDFDELDEIRTTADLIIAASDSPRHLSQAAIDLALGLGAIRPGSSRDPDHSSAGGTVPPLPPLPSPPPRPKPSEGSGPLRLV